MDTAKRDDVTLSVPASPHTFRHTIAIHLLYGHIHPKVLQGLMGHEKFETTEVYTKIFALDVAISQQVRFTHETRDAQLLLPGCNVRDNTGFYWPDNGRNRVRSWVREGLKPWC